MNLQDITDFLDETLQVEAFDDVSNNGLQIAREGADVSTVAFAVDASLRAVEAAAEAGAQLLVVHHGISWGGGVRYVRGGVYRVIRAAIERNVALYAAHLPLDAHPTLGNNAVLAHELALTDLTRAFSYRGHLLGFVGRRGGETVGVCSGGAGEFAEEAARLGCTRFVTGEASWGEVVAAENAGITMELLGHYESETGGVRALARHLRNARPVETVDLTEKLRRAS